jgi:hypothetical protein
MKRGYAQPEKTCHYCGDGCRIGYDWFCPDCVKYYHFACGPRNEDLFVCTICNNHVYDKTTIGYFAFNTFEKGDRIGDIYDLNYILNGKIVVYWPCISQGIDKRLAISALPQISLDFRRDDSHIIADWYNICGILGDLRYSIK